MRMLIERLKLRGSLSTRLGVEMLLLERGLDVCSVMLRSWQGVTELTVLLWCSVAQTRGLDRERCSAFG